MRKWLIVLVLAPIFSSQAPAQSNPLWHTQKVKNYLPHMTWPEVEDLLSRTDMVIIPVPAIEQHGPQLPIGTDYFIGEELGKLIAQKTDVLVAPILLPGISPYHMEFPGTITLSEDTVQRVYFEAVQSLIHHGFRRFMILPSHAGNRNVSRYIIDRINQETAGIAVELNDAAQPLLKSPPRQDVKQFDRHAGVGETSSGLYLFPNLVDMSKAGKNEVTLPDHLQKALPRVITGDDTATTIFLAEALKPKDTGKYTSTREMTKTGVWSERDTREASVERGRQESEAFVDASVQFIEQWKALKPLVPLTERRKY
ncbi:MAG TPA: creatininase family protein [Candidatus Sulfotelmatobacter sp.]|jgi:creatinine amidohydrolase